MELGRYRTVLWLIVIIVAINECSSQFMNFTIGGKAVIGKRLQEKIGDYEQCYVDIIVHNSSTFRYGLAKATVTVLSGQLQTPPLNTPFSQGLTDSNGKICLPVQCRTEARIFVEKNSSPLLALNKTIQQQNLPLGFSVEFEAANEVIKFYSFAWGNLNGKAGPVYSSLEKQECQSAGLNNNYFVFSYIAIPDKLYSTPAPVSGITDPIDPRFILMWRYGLVGATSPARSCYFKVKVKVSSTQASVSASSRENNATGQLLGTFQTGPQYDPSSSDTIDKAACIQYRCPIKDLIKGDSVDTYIEGTIKAPGSPQGCCVRFSTGTSKLFNVNATNFSTKKALEVQDNYGSIDGIYIHENQRTARVKCFTGLEYLYTDYAMNVSTGYAFEYDCTLNADCRTPIVLG